MDAKGSVASQIIAANSLLAGKRIHPDDVAFLYVVGEETGGDGMRAANDLKLKPKSIIFGEPTEGKLASGHKGMLSFKLTAKGKAAHSGYPWLGLSANEVLVDVLTCNTVTADSNGGVSVKGSSGLPQVCLNVSTVLAYID